MRMIQAHCSSTAARGVGLAMGLAMVLAAAPWAVWAQQGGARGGSSNLEWPRTFTGQPDFAFTRDEAMADSRQKAARGGDAPVIPPTMVQMASDDAVPDPLGLKVAEVASGTEVRDASGTLVQRANRQTLLDQLLAGAGQLPTYATPTLPDMREFKASLANTISRTLAGWQPPQRGYSVGGALAGLTLQAVVTSPETYAVINGARYKVGDSFVLRMPVFVPDMAVMDALNALMPAPGTLPEDAMKPYTEAYEDAIAAYARVRAQTPGVGQQMVNIPVKVEAIAPRTVRLDVNGSLHDLIIRYSY